MLSAHRTPAALEAFLADVESRGAQVFVAAAGGAAHLAGVVASKTLQPVLGVPMGTQLGGLDSLLSIVQMPAGIPVGTLAIGRAGAVNAALSRRRSSRCRTRTSPRGCGSTARSRRRRFSTSAIRARRGDLRVAQGEASLAPTAGADHREHVVAVALELRRPDAFDCRSSPSERGCAAASSRSVVSGNTT